MNFAFAARASDLPVYVAQEPNLHDYTLFANNGWDGNWLVGYNTCWIKRVPAVASGAYQRAYVGVKLGRAKSTPGKIMAALASTPSWTSDQSFLLTTTDDIPLEGDMQSAIANVGESQWFWREVPLSSVNLAGENYIAVWSPTPELLTISSSPVIAAAWGGKEQNTWLAKDLAGVAPKDSSTALQSPISYFQPAIALKLIPQGAFHPVTVRIADWKAGTPDHLKPTIVADVRGDGIEKVWVEYGKDNTWTKIGRPIWQPPFHLTLEQALLPKGKVKLRVAASNMWEERGASEPFSIEVSPIHAKK